MSTNFSEDPMLAPLLTLFKARRYVRCLEGLEKLAAEGSTPAAIAVAHIFFHGGGGVRRDYRRAKYWLELALQDMSSLTYASHRLGIIYYQGLGVAKNPRTAYRYFRKAALHGDSRSLLMVGAMQRDGDGVQRKRRSARILLLHSIRNKCLGLHHRLLALLWLATTR